MFPSWYPVQRIPQGWGLTGADVGAEVRQVLETNFGQLYRGGEVDQSVSSSQRSSNIAHFFGYVSNGPSRAQGPPDGKVDRVEDDQSSWAKAPNMYGYEWSFQKHLLATLNETAQQFVASRVYG